MADYWIKLYLEIIDDPKMATLPDRLWRRVIELFLLAGKYGVNKDGTLPDTRQLAWMLRMPTDELAHDIDQLQSTGIIEAIPNGWRVVNFAKRQAPMTNAEKQRAYRERQHHNQYNKGGVTDTLPKVTQKQITETETETETDNRKESALTSIQIHIEQLTGIPPTTPADIKALDDLENAHVNIDDITAGYQWLCGQGKALRYYSSLVGPAKTAMAQRIQRNNGNGATQRRQRLVIRDGVQVIEDIPAGEQ